MPLNPRWVLWKAVTGESRPYEFMIWLSRKWAAFERETFVLDPRSARNTEFDAWLSAKFSQDEEAA